MVYSTDTAHPGTIQVPSGGGGVAAAPAAGGATPGATAEAKEEEKQEEKVRFSIGVFYPCRLSDPHLPLTQEESDDDMGFGLFD